MKSRDIVTPDPVSASVGQQPDGTVDGAPWRAVVTSERMTAVAARIAETDDPEAAEADFWATVPETPLWEPDPELPGAWRVTFLWHGNPGTTSHVTLNGMLTFAEIDYGGTRFVRIPRTDIWHLTLRVPPRTRSAYSIAANGLLGPLSDHDPRTFWRYTATWSRDPFNPKSTLIPANELVPEWTPRIYSVLEAPDALDQPWSTPQPGVPAGSVEQHEHTSRALQNTRRVWTYTPASWSPEQRDLPLLVAFDGWNAVNVTRLPVVLDNLIAAGEIPPVAAVMADSGTMEMRGRELYCHEPFVTFLTDELLPWARGRWGLSADRTRTLVAGVSAGGQAALFAALRRPDVFGKVIAQLAAITEEEPTAVADLARRQVGSDAEALQIYLDVGLLEVGGRRGFCTGVHMVRDLLLQSGHTVLHADLPCAHDELVVRESIADGLKFLLAPRA